MEKKKSSGKSLYRLGTKVGIRNEDYKHRIHPVIKSGGIYEGIITNIVKKYNKFTKQEYFQYTIKLTRYDDPHGLIHQKHLSLIKNSKYGFPEEQLFLLIDMDKMLDNLDKLEEKMKNV